jgi:hypothetical protein
MGWRSRLLWVALATLTLAVAVFALVPQFYHDWWWWDVLTHAVVSGVLAAWWHALDPRSRLGWPVFVVAMLAWEWLEMTTPILLSPGQVDLLSDLSVNVVAFWTIRSVLRRVAPSETPTPTTDPLSDARETPRGRGSTDGIRYE